MNILPAALQGMNQADARIDRSALRIASSEANDTVDLSAEMINLLQARIDFETSTRLVHVADQMSAHLLDLLA